MHIIEATSGKPLPFEPGEYINVLARPGDVMSAVQLLKFHGTIFEIAFVECNILALSEFYQSSETRIYLLPRHFSHVKVFSEVLDAFLSYKLSRASYTYGHLGRMTDMRSLKPDFIEDIILQCNTIVLSGE